MSSTTQLQEKWLLKRYHTLASRLGLKEYEKAAIVGAYGVDSSRHLTAAQLTEVCDALDRRLNPELDEMNLWRKRLMAAVGGWLKMLNKDANSAQIKAIACRAAACKSFNAIPKERVINLYHAFLNKQKDYKRVQLITADEVAILEYLN